MYCPQCHKTETRVIETRTLQAGATIRRRRRCDECSYRFTTYEKVEIQLPEIVKADGRREVFNPEKLMRGIKKACEKRDISVDVLDNLIHETIQEIIESGQKEVSTDRVGNIVMKKLYLVDVPSYVRFASFYWNFDDVDSFVNHLREDRGETHAH